uniref:Ribbon-helix-helix protein, CopG family n=1 Tax=Caldisericum exile TaxID=693075 RepID=A0A7C4U2D0_9BACT
MKEHDSYIALRLPASLKAEINKLVESGKFKNASQVIREAVRRFLLENA